MLLFGVLSGLYRELLIVFSIIMVHEMGHLITAKLWGYKINQICLYPYGACFKYQDDINKSLFSELMILIMGPLIQCCYYLIMKNISIIDFQLLKNYHFGILFFNLLPIYPLDGGKLINIIFNYKYSYLMSFKISIISSFLVLWVIFVYFWYSKYDLQLVIYYLLLLTKIIKESKSINIYFEKFLLERYLKKFKWKKEKKIKDEKNMARDYKHLFLSDNKYIDEETYLKKRYKRY